MTDKEDQLVQQRLSEMMAELFAKACNKMMILIVNVRDFILALFGKLEYAAVC